MHRCHFTNLVGTPTDCAVAPKQGNPSLKEFVFQHLFCVRMFGCIKDQHHGFGSVSCQDEFILQLNHWKTIQCWNIIYGWRTGGSIGEQQCHDALGKGTVDVWFVPQFSWRISTSSGFEGMTHRTLLPHTRKHYIVEFICSCQITPPSNSWFSLTCSH